MFTLKHLKTLQHVSTIIQTIFRELVCSLFKSHTPNVMLPHHHIDFYIFNKF